MGKKRKRPAPGAARVGLSPQRVEQLLLATSFPRLHMALILALAAVGAFLTSASFVALGLSSMGLRYALAVVGGYLFFLSLVRLWIAYQTRNWSFGRRSEARQRSNDQGSFDLPDLSALGDLGSAAAESGLSGGGGAFGGAGASGSFGDAATSEGSSSGALDAA